MEPHLRDLQDFLPGQRQPRRCTVCERPHPLMSMALDLCPVCARSAGGAMQAREAHERSRRRFGLPEVPPQTGGGSPCGQCAAGCVIGEGERGFCGLRTVREGKLVQHGGTPERGVLNWYRDPLPTNCVAEWVCAGRAQNGRHNLAVAYSSCTLDCLFCQNWQFREVSPEQGQAMSARELAAQANPYTFCVCFFGGDPASQMPHAIATAELLAERGVRACWETAGTSAAKYIDRAVELSLASGGCLKFDLKAFTEPLHVALTGSSNQATLANFARAARRFRERPGPPLLVASTLLVPGYVDPREVGRIASFIAEQDPGIPYALLAFGPGYLMNDLPRTTLAHAEEARQAALGAGLRNVRIGNSHLLGESYPTGCAVGI